MNSITYQGNYQTSSAQTNSVAKRFFLWTREQEKNQIAWVGIAIIFMTAFFFPITMAAILFNGASFKLIIGALVALSMVVIAQLASLPTRYTIPVFLLGILMDLVLIFASFII